MSPLPNRATTKLLTKDKARRIATNIGKHARRHAGRHVRWHTRMQAVENRWKSSGKHVGGTKNKHGVVFIWSRRAEERGVCRLVDTALSFKSFRTVLGRAPFLVSDCSFCQSFAARVSSDSPRLKAFCRVAPSVLLNVRAMFAARVLFAASFFKLRTSFAVHDRLFILRLQDQKMKIVLLPPNK